MTCTSKPDPQLESLFPALDTSSPCIPPIPLSYLIKHNGDLISEAERVVLEEAKARLVSSCTSHLLKTHPFLPLGSIQQDLPLLWKVICHDEEALGAEKDGSAFSDFGTEKPPNTLLILDWRSGSWRDHLLSWCALHFQGPWLHSWKIAQSCGQHHLEHPFCSQQPSSSILSHLLVFQVLSPTILVLGIRLKPVIWRALPLCEL